MALLEPVTRAHAGLILAMVIWGSAFVALKVAISDVDAYLVIFLRMLVALTAFSIAWYFVKPSFSYQPGDWKFLLALALFEPCFYFIFEALALKYTSAGQAGMVTATLPLLIAFSAFLFFGERNTIAQWSGLLIALAGVVLMSLSSQDLEQAPEALKGNFLEFLAMCMATGYTLLTKRLISRYPAFVITAWQSLIGTLFFLPIVFFVDWPTHWQTPDVLSIVYLGLIVSTGAYGLFNYSLGHLKASTAGAYINLIPVAALCLSIAILGETVAALQWLAIIFIFGGVYLSRERS